MPNANRGACGFRSDEFDEYSKPSKTQKKREMQALQEVGETLLTLSTERIKQLALPENLEEALLHCQQIRDFEGKRRQTQYVGKLMRSLESEQLATIQTSLQRWQGKSNEETAKLHRLEKWRERLLADDQALNELLAQYPMIEVSSISHLRMLIRNARKERTDHKPPKAFRELFQQLSQLL